MNRGLFIRLLVAAVCVVAFYLVLPPFLHILGFSLNGDLMVIVKVVVALVALWYVFWGPSNWPWAP